MTRLGARLRTQAPRSLSTKQDVQEVMVDEEEFTSNTDLSQQADCHECMQPGRGGLTCHGTTLDDSADATVGLLEEQGQELRVTPPGSCDDVLKIRD